MATTNARKHQIPSGSDTTVSRETIFESFGNSIRDVVPVANTTERAQLVAALTAAGQAPSSSSPLLVWRNDAAGLHKIEWSADGSVWVSSTGVLRFDSQVARDTWTTANSGYLVVGDRCFAGAGEYVWFGSVWRRPVTVGGGSLVGAATPTAEAAVFSQRGSRLGTVDTAGNGFNVTFPFPFPNGVLDLQVTNGDGALSGRILGLVDVNLSSFGVKWENVATAGTRRINFDAIGW